MQFKRIAVCVALAFAPSAFAEEATEATLPDVEVIGKKIQPLPALSDSALGGANITRQRASTSDTAKMLDGQPGVSLYGAGGVSSLPVIHGMADDRVRVKVDGMDLISACGNHMNPPLSYIDPSNVGSVKVFAGIAPVSVGGDSIGGTIQVASHAPEFAAAGETLVKGQIGTYFRSNGNATTENLSATVAGEKLSVKYSGSSAQSEDYKAGSNFKTSTATNNNGGTLPLDVVGSSMYKSTNQALDFALRQENHLVELKVGRQDIPYQGFPNQRMDMTGNDSKQINLRYTGQYQWGALEARAYNEKTRHVMQFYDDKRFWYVPNSTASAPCSPIGPTCAAGMPMDTEGKTTGTLVKADILLSERDILRVGGEVQNYTLNDWWDPSGGGMWPNTFWNINNGKRDRLAFFGEWEARWNPQWVSQLGVRREEVKMNTGTVQGYSTNGTYLAEATAFNARDRQRTDSNWDLTALARFTPDNTQAFEAGYAQKTRSPNLYERYTWSTGGMAMRMINFAGDGNGYYGDPDLKPEVAHTFSATADWHDAAEEQWGMKITPYYTKVQNYIDAVRCSTTNCIGSNANNLNRTVTTGFVYLRFANQDARLYGVDMSGHFPLAQTGDYGSFTAKGVLNYVNGKNETTGDNLYNIMPLNAKLAVIQKAGNWTNTIEAQLVDAKQNISQVRNELKTSGYGLLNLRMSYEVKQTQFDIGIENVLNRFYNHPLGGAYTGQGTTMSGTGVAWGTPVPGMGRSLYAGATLKF
ncbi:MAG: TonB-dependent receptor [Gallionellales bacterium RIFCSPLOWO2_02_FULL_57_47]|nr:MAG: TonB-dependent receptor [Gallionellales bacterium RIFCSPLOWO2_02_FULL_57_47]OGT11049.1 MAG: TonB-dependent receptor [Gallionellales bacterium RIFCSPHIGHO2_02_FULL_57_16]